MSGLRVSILMDDLENSINKLVVQEKEKWIKQVNDAIETIILREGIKCNCTQNPCSCCNELRLLAAVRKEIGL